MWPPRALLLLLAALPARADPGPRWQPQVDGDEWLAALDAADANVSSAAAPADGWCAGDDCELELLRRERLEVVKQKVLSELGLEAAPQGRGRRLAAEFLDRVVSEQKLVNMRNRRELKPPADDAERQAVWMLAKQCECRQTVTGSPSLNWQ